MRINIRPTVALAALAIVASLGNPAHAGDGRVAAGLAGVAAGVVVGAAIAQPAPPPVLIAPPTYYAPPPVAYYAPILPPPVFYGAPRVYYAPPYRPIYRAEPHFDWSRR